MDLSPLFAQCLSSVYAVTGIVFAASYLPRLACMLRDLPATAHSHSLLSELIWTACRMVSLLYVAAVAQQPLIALLVVLDLFGRVACVLILLHARRHLRVTAQ